MKDASTRVTAILELFGMSYLSRMDLLQRVPKLFIPSTLRWTVMEQIHEGHQRYGEMHAGSKGVNVLARN